MKIKLKVVKGLGVGREVKIPTPKCLIGRDEDCHMRPKSEAVSRKHCVIFTKEGKVFVRDLHSRNGTYVNDALIKEDYSLSAGDMITVGPITFEVLIDHALGGDKKPKVNSIRDVVERTTAGTSEPATIEEGDVSDWLDEADKVDRQRRLSDPETRQLKLDETDRVDLQKAIEERAKLRPEEQQKAEVAAVKDAEEKKKVPGKLPARAENVTKDSREAAAKMLKKFFNNR